MVNFGYGHIMVTLQWLHKRTRGYIQVFVQIDEMLLSGNLCQ